MSLPTFKITVMVNLLFFYFFTYQIEVMVNHDCQLDWIERYVRDK
jgi:hypothetical protein